MPFLITNIVFDVDDTLYDQQAPFEAAVLKISPYVLAEDMHPLYIRFRHYSDENFPKVMAGSWTLEEMRSHRIAESLKDLDYPQLTAEECLTFQKIYEDELANITMHHEVKKTLDYLKEQNIPIGIITNGPTDHQFKKIKQLAVENWVNPNHIIISQATGFQKPEPEIFYLAEKNFSLIGENTLYVGDSFDSDVTGSKNSGWHALWFNHRQRKIPAGKSPIFDLEINSFNQLLETIQAIF